MTYIFSIDYSTGVCPCGPCCLYSSYSFLLCFYYFYILFPSNAFARFCCFLFLVPFHCLQLFLIIIFGLLWCKSLFHKLYVYNLSSWRLLWGQQILLPLFFLSFVLLLWSLMLSLKVRCWNSADSVRLLRACFFMLFLHLSLPSWNHFPVWRSVAFRGLACVGKLELNSSVFSQVNVLFFFFSDNSSEYKFSLIIPVISFQWLPNSVLASEKFGACLHNCCPFLEICLFFLVIFLIFA